MEDVKQWHIESIAKMYKKAISIVLERSKKYATEDDPFLNFRRGAAFANTTVEQGIMTRIGDKLSRLQNALERDDDDAFSDEAFDDTILDLCNYFVILRNWRVLQAAQRELEAKQLNLFADEVVEDEPLDKEPEGPVKKAIRGLASSLGVTVE
jgi:hypothetical protein